MLYWDEDDYPRESGTPRGEHERETIRKVRQKRLEGAREMLGRVTQLGGATEHGRRLEMVVEDLLEVLDDLVKRCYL